jgi:hypothetical protein
MLGLSLADARVCPMTYSMPAPVVSGVPYAVLDVGGRAPRTVEDFAGRVTLTVEGRTGRHVLVGDASVTDGVVRLHQKAADGDGKDIRTWRIAPTDDGGFCAETT